MREIQKSQIFIGNALRLSDTDLRSRSKQWLVCLVKKHRENLEQKRSTMKKVVNYLECSPQLHLVLNETKEDLFSTAMLQ